MLADIETCCFARRIGKRFFWSEGWSIAATSGSAWLEVRKRQHLYLKLPELVVNYSKQLINYA